MANKFSEITHQILELTQKCISNSTINAELYGKYDVKRGLRDINGKGVLAGLTDISEVRSYTVVDSEIVPCEGKLFYRGVDIEQIVSGFIRRQAVLVRGNGVFTFIRRSANGVGTDRVSYFAGELQDIANEFCTRYYHEGAKLRHDEHFSKKCADPIFL